MSDHGGLEVLLKAGVIEKASLSSLKLGDTGGLLQPANVERLATALLDLLPRGTTGLITGTEATDVLLAYVISQKLNIPRALVYDVDGVAHAIGRLVEGIHACLIAAVVSDAWVLDEFEGVCRGWSVEPVTAVVGVDRLTRHDAE